MCLYKEQYNTLSLKVFEENQGKKVLVNKTHFLIKWTLMGRKDSKKVAYPILEKGSKNTWVINFK